MAISDYKSLVEAAHKKGKVHYQTFAFSPNSVGFYRWVSTFAQQTSSTSLALLPRLYMGTSGSFVPVSGNTFRDIYTGPVPATGEQKLLTGMMLVNSFTSGVSDVLLPIDVLGYYPAVDTATVGTTTLNNSQTLPAYTTGDGVQAVILATAVVTPNVVSCTMSYTNQNGVAGRTASFYIQATNVPDEVVTGTGANSSGSVINPSPFVPLQGSDRGIRSIQSITTSDTCASWVNILLCYPLVGTPINIASIGTKLGMVQVDSFSGYGLPSPIRNDACIHMLAASTSFATPNPSIKSRGMMEFIWG